jgi:hypothetical protein
MLLFVMFSLFMVYLLLMFVYTKTSTNRAFDSGRSLA